MDCVPSFGPRAYIASWPLFRQRLLCGPDISRGHLTKRPVPTITNALSPSSIRLGRRPLKPLRRVQIPLVTPFSEDCNWRHATITPFRGSKGIPLSLFLLCIWNPFRLTREDGLIVSGFRPLYLFHRPSLARTYGSAADAFPAAGVSISSRVYDQVGRKRLASSGPCVNVLTPLWSREPRIDNYGVTCNQKCYVLDFISG